MLQLITGRSGFGKTAEVYRELSKYVETEVPLFLLVPEQASYDSERHLLEQLGPVAAGRVRVVSFTRLVDTVFREIGGMVGRRMDATLSMLLLSQALHEVADHLTVYRRHVDNPDYLTVLAGMLSECKQCGITPTLLEETAAAVTSPLLRDKLHEFSLIFGAYEALVSSASLLDPLDDLSWLANRIADCHAFDGAYVYVDGFKGFTNQEFNVLERLMPKVARLTVTLCADDATERPEHKFDRFATAMHTATVLRDAAYRAHCPIAAVRRLSDNHRSQNEALRVLEQSCFTADATIYDEPTDAVRVVSCDDRVAECRFAAREIRRLLREEGGHCRDFTVVARDLTAYADLMDTALRREGLPVCRDYREPILTQPLITLVESALAVATGGFDSTDILRLTKTGLAGFSTTSASLLENYVFLWNIRGRQWLSDFTGHPDGLNETETETSTNRLLHLNLLRRRLARPLERFRSRLRAGSTGRDYAEAVYTLLNDMHIARTVRFQVARLDAAGEHTLADCQSRLWDYLMSLLDKMVVGLGHTRLSPARFAELFHLAVAGDDLGNIPQSLDGVVVGAADRIRYTHPRTVIILGANEGVFPAYPATGGMLSEHERRMAIEAGLPMTDTAEGEAAEERFYAYMAVAAPSHRLIITYANSAGKDTLFPSALVSAVQHVIPQCVTEQIGQGNHPADSESETDAFAAFAATHRENSSIAATYRDVFAALPQYAARCRAMERLEQPFAFEQSAAARRLFGEDLRLSPTQVETFHECRFAYFCRYGLHAMPRRKAELGAAESGQLVHHVMSTLLPQYTADGIDTVTHERVKADITPCIQTYLKECMGATAVDDPQWDRTVARLTRLSGYILWHVVREFQNNRFTPVDYELPVGSADDGIPAWRIPLSDGTSLRVCGQVDRVDTYQSENGNTYLRIVDYKTGNKVFDLSDVLEGINLQMLIYLFSICETGGERYGDVIPSGILYQPVRFPVIQVPRDTDNDTALLKQQQALCPNGLLLDDPDVLTAMEPDLRGRFIPASLKKNEISSNSVATLAQFGRLQKHIERLLSRMAEQLHSGDIAAVPKQHADKEGRCRYCDYRDICGHESTDPVHTIADLAAKDALAALEVTDDEQ